MTSVVKIDGEQLPHSVSVLSLRDEKGMKSKSVFEEESYENHSGVCAICLNKIALQETALVKGCEHAYCFSLLNSIRFVLKYQENHLETKKIKLKDNAVAAQQAETGRMTAILRADALSIYNRYIRKIQFQKPTCFYQYFCLLRPPHHDLAITCILRWATCREKPTCPQCKHPFESLNVHRSLDGRIHDYMFEESVCLLLRASWFTPLPEENSSTSEGYDDLLEYYCSYEEDNDEEVYYLSSSSLRIGNRRWGDNGYVRAGRQEARPAHQPNIQDSGAGSSREPKMKGVAKSTVGRRAKRTLKREAANKAAATGRKEESSVNLEED